MLLLGCHFCNEVVQLNQLRRYMGASAVTVSETVRPYFISLLELANLEGASCTKCINCLNCLYEMTMSLLCAIKHKSNARRQGPLPVSTQA